MATRRWKGKAKDVIQVDLVTIALTWTAADTITVTVDGIDLVVTIGSLITTAQVANTLYEAFNGSTLTDTTASASPTIAQGGGQAIAQLREIVATVSGSVVTLTAVTAGKPFTITVTENTASTGTATNSSSVTCTGKHFFSDADNWSGDTVPVDGDTIIFDQGNIDCKYGLTPAIQPTVFRKTKGYTGRIGLPAVNVDDTSYPYPEYRTQSLTFDDNGGATCTYHFEEGEGTGSQLVRIDAGAGASIFNFYGFGARLITGQPCILLEGTNAANVINMPQGDGALGFFSGTASTLVAARVGNGTGRGATLICGDTCTLTGIVLDIGGGAVTIKTATASGDIDIHSGGTLIVEGTGAHADIDVQNGLCDYRSSGTITTLAVRSAGKFTKENDYRANTITNVVQAFKNANIQDPNKALTLTAGFKLNGCTLDDVDFNFGTDRTYTVA